MFYKCNCLFVVIPWGISIKLCLTAGQRHKQILGVFYLKLSYLGKAEAAGRAMPPCPTCVSDVLTTVAILPFVML